MSEVDEVVGEFLVESREALEEYDQDLLALEQDPTDAEVLGRIFRNLHTIKGTCGFLGFGRLEAVAHAGENLLGLLRDGEVVVDQEVADALLATGDAIRDILARIEADGAEGGDDHAALVAKLEELQDPQREPGQAGGAEGHTAVEGEAAAEGHAAAEGDVAAEAGAAATGPVGEPAATAAAPEAADEPEDHAEVAGGRQAQGGDSTVRVDVALLDELMNLVGELVLARNQIVQIAGDDRESELAGASGRLNLVTTELQEGVMKTRMQPIGNVWSRFPRVVRDLSTQFGKRVRVEMEGKETELDKSLIEAVKDPLTHLVRNAVDHGIETPEEREAAGKPAEGRLWLRAFHEGGQVNVEIADDGAGIDPERIRRKAVDKGVITAEQAEVMGDREAVSLIFAAGFSTAAAVTNVSGRGVGMDVVKRDVEKIGGTVDVASEPGQGTTFRVKIPLTLAIIPALVVTSGGAPFAIPQINLTEMVRLEAGAAHGIEHIHGSPVYRLRGHLLPIVHLDEQLGDAEPGGARGDESCNIVVLQADDQQLGLVVDDVSDTQEIVVKPMGHQVKDIPIFAGSTIMGDGRVALILDVLGIAQRAGVVGESRERALLDDLVEEDADGVERQTLLLVGLGDDRRAAVPLSDVARLEEFEADAIERTGHQEVVQYRGEILPLVRLGDVLGYGGEPVREDGKLDVVVHSRGGHTVGLVVGRILDIVEQEIDVDERAGGHLLGSAVVQERVTDVVDVGEAVARAIGAPAA